VVKHDTEATRVESSGETAPGHSDAPAVASVERGHTIGRYLVVEPLGAGAMGVVYRAYDPDLDRALALKVVSQHADGSTRGAREQARLLREAQAMARVSHPGVIQVFDVGELDAAVYVAMELVDGVTLREWLVTKRSPAEILQVFEAAGRGLSAAHGQGLTHRDFKPDNVMVDQQGRPRVLDFGLARASQRPELESSTETLRSGTTPALDASMTEAGSLLGTPAYMSPEQYRGEPADHRSDQFSFCVALFEALVGRRPFSGKTIGALSAAVTAGRIEMPSRAPVSRTIMNAIVRGLSVAPEDRFPSMDTLLAVLQPRRRRYLGLLVGAAGVTLGAVAWARSAAPPEEPTPCTGAAEVAEAVWSDARRTAIADAFARTSNALGESVWADGAARVDAYVTAWVDARTNACRATRVQGEQSEALLDRRIACYDARLRTVDATLRALEDADATTVEHARDALDGLPALVGCAQTERLLESAPRPTDAATLETLEGLERRYDDLSAQVMLGHYDAVLEPAQALADDAQGLGWPPIRVQAWSLVGDVQAEAGGDEGSVTAFEQALHAAIEGNDDDAAAVASIDLGLSVGYFAAETERGLEFLKLGRAFASRSPRRTELEMMATEHEAAIAVTRGEMSRALELHETVRDYWGGREDGELHRAGSLIDIATVLVSTGRATEAVDVLREVVEVHEREYGKDHPLTANAVRELGTSLSKLEHFDEAETQLRRALSIQEAARGRESRKVAILLDDLGRVMRARGDLDGAIKQHKEAYAVLERVHGTENPALVISGMNIGYTLNAAGRFAEAQEVFRRAHDLAVRVSGPEHPHVVYTANAVASALIDQDRFDEAYVYAKKALDLDGKAEAPPTLFAESRFLATHALWKDGNVPAATKDRARSLARSARDLYKDGPPHWAVQIERIEAWLAEHG
jgi:tetratricopeptide (TPR) repeat protein